jgi:hypothetical protein
VLDANPPFFLAKVLADESLSKLEHTAWKAWINTQTSSAPRAFSTSTTTTAPR